MIQRVFAACAASVVALACGNGPAPSTAPAATASASASTSAPPTVPTGRGPSATIRRRWALGTGGVFFLYANVETLMATQFARAFVPALLEMPGLSPEQARCGEKLAASTKEVLMGTNQDGVIALLRIDEGASPLATCIKALSADPSSLPGAPGAPEAWNLGGTWMVHEPGMVLVGSPEAIRAALAVTGTPNAPSSLDLGPAQHLAFSAVVGANVPLQGTLAIDAAHFALQLDANPPGEGDAEKMAAEFEKIAATSAFPGFNPHQNQMARRVLDATKVSHQNGHLRALFEVRGGPVDQGARFGELASLAIYTFRRYLESAKAAEAQAVVAEIARSYVTLWEREETKPVARAKKKLVSFPPVPSTVPHGQKYASQPGDWKAWAPMRFEMTEPQYFQYEVKAAKDGESADIIARGDLNGDGKTSLYTLHVKVDRKKDSTLVLAPKLEITDAFE